MPASILAYTTTKSYLEVQYVQKALLNAFEADFGKYAKRAQYRHLKKILEVAPRLIGDHVKYSRIDPELSNPTREMKQALEMLRLAGLVHTVFAASGGALPLLSHIRETIFKLIFLDIGLLSQKMSIDPNWPHLMTGSLTEQFVGQEFLATSDSRLDAHLFFWTREKGLSEVDYLIPHQGVVYPIEVKAGKSGKLKSLFQFIQEKRVPFGIKISQNPLGIEQRVLSIPLYLTAHTERLIDNAILKEF
jgi:predicted AAA+ superfamily ATPase